MSRHNSPLLDLTKTDADTAKFFVDYFEAKSEHDAAATAGFFSPEAITYVDAPLGWAMNGKQNIEAAFHAAMPRWRDGRSYPTAILGSFANGNGSALVSFTNTPGIVGNELLHIVGAVDVHAGKILRWVDYWDSSSIDEGFRTQVRTPADKFPITFGEDKIVTKPSGPIADASAALQRAIASGDSQKIAALFDYDATWEDLPLRTRIVGRPAIERYLRESVKLAPYGDGTRMRHALGSGGAGGFEWFAAPASKVLSGLTGLVLTPSGQIGRSMAIYDGKLLPSDTRRALIQLATAP